MSQTEQDILFGVMAVQSGVVSPEQVADAQATISGGSGFGLRDQLVDSGFLSKKDAEDLSHLVEAAVKSHDGDHSATLKTFWPDDETFGDFKAAADFLSKPAIGQTVLASEDDLKAFEADLVPGVKESPGRYRVKGEHARGGMGRILLVHDTYLGRDIALKELLLGRGASSIIEKTSHIRHSMPIMARFLQEAKITGKLEHPSIVPVYELGHRSDGALYYTMKLVKGKTLGDALKETDGLPGRLMLLPHFVDLCNAMAYAHSRGVIHRDLKPGNVMVGEFGETVVLDWGLAKAMGTEEEPHGSLEDVYRTLGAADQTDEGKTRYGEAMGTPVFMPPEQAAGALEKIDHRSDIYSLGAVLYVYLTGKTPFTGTSAFNVLEKVVSEYPPEIRDIEPKAPPELAAICDRAMEKAPEDRYQSAKDLAAEIQRFQSGALVEAYSYGTYERVLKFLKRYRAIVITAAVFLVAVMGLSIYYVLNLIQARNEEARQKVRAQDSAVLAQQRQEEAERALAGEREARQREEEARALAKEQEREAERARLREEQAIEEARRLGQMLAMQDSELLGSRENVQITKDKEIGVRALRGPILTVPAMDIAPEVPDGEALGRMVSEVYEKELVDTRRFILLDQDLISRYITPNQKPGGGTNPMLESQFALAASLKLDGAEYALSVQLVQSGTGDPITDAYTVSFENKEDIEDEAAALVKQLINAYPVAQGHVMSVDGPNLTLDFGFANLRLLPHMPLAVIRLKQVIHPVTKEELGLSVDVIDDSIAVESVDLYGVQARFTVYDEAAPPAVEEKLLVVTR